MIPRFRNGRSIPHVVSDIAVFVLKRDVTLQPTPVPLAPTPMRRRWVICIHLLTWFCHRGGRGWLLPSEARWWISKQWRSQPPFSLWRHSHCDVIRYWACHAHRYGRTDTLPRLIYKDCSPTFKNTAQYSPKHAISSKKFQFFSGEGARLDSSGPHSSPPTKHSGSVSAR